MPPFTRLSNLVLVLPFIFSWSAQGAAPLTKFVNVDVEAPAAVKTRLEAALLRELRKWPDVAIMDGTVEYKLTAVCTATIAPETVVCGAAFLFRSNLVGLANSLCPQLQKNENWKYFGDNGKQTYVFLGQNVVARAYPQLDEIGVQVAADFNDVVLEPARRLETKLNELIKR